MKTWLKRHYLAFIKRQFYKHCYRETYQYFEDQSALYPRWWLNYNWWKPTDSRQANPVYMSRFPTEEVWHA